MTDRNNTILAIIVVAVVLCGTLLTTAYIFGQLGFDWHNPISDGLDPNADNYSFTFEEVSIEIAPEIGINIGIDVGGISVFFENNATLVYRLDIIIQNDTYRQHGMPTPVFNSLALDFHYPVFEANLTLGSATFYDFDINIDVGSANIDAGAFAHVSDVDIDIDVGSIGFAMVDDFTLDGNVTVNLDIGVGSTDLVIGLPTNIAGRITGSTSTGDFDVYSFGWNEISASRYETTNYATAQQIITITSYIGTGSQFIVLNQ